MDDPKWEQTKEGHLTLSVGGKIKATIIPKPMKIGNHEEPVPFHDVLDDRGQKRTFLGRDAAIADVMRFLNLGKKK